MRRTVLLLLLVLALLSNHASDAALPKRVPSNIAGIDFAISCVPGPPAADYKAETASGIAPTDPYAVERGADRGLVNLMNQGGRRVHAYVVPRHLIRAIVRVRYDMTVLDRVDLVFVPCKVILVHTSTANAGIFTYSEIYELPRRPGGPVGQALLGGNPDLSRMLQLGLPFYQPRTGGCA